jgi:hypothetical protein
MRSDGRYLISLIHLVEFRFLATNVLWKSKKMDHLYKGHRRGILVQKVIRLVDHRSLRPSILSAPSVHCRIAYQGLFYFIEASLGSS